jgi:hypothetical protein
MLNVGPKAVAQAQAQIPKTQLQQRFVVESAQRYLRASIVVACFAAGWPSGRWWHPSPDLDLEAGCRAPKPDRWRSGLVPAEH